MEWFKQKTSIAGVQVSNWMIVLGAIIIVLLISQKLPLSETGTPTSRLITRQ